LTITTDGGTTFTVDKTKLTITRSDQPECTIPMADFEEFVKLYYDADGDGDDDDDDFDEDHPEDRDTQRLRPLPR
jgi:hypothetical protein